MEGRETQILPSFKLCRSRRTLTKIIKSNKVVVDDDDYDDDLRGRSYIHECMEHMNTDITTKVVLSYEAIKFF